MTLNFILVLLLVIGLIVANLALLKYGSKPLPKKKAQPASTGNNAARTAQSQAAVSTALPFSQVSTNKPAMQEDKAVAELSSPNSVDSPGDPQA